MTLRSTIMIRVGLLIFSMALALSGTFYWIFARDVKQRSQQTVEAAFSLLEDSLHRKKREMAREAEKINYPVRAALDRLATVRRSRLLPQTNTRLAYLKNVMAISAPLADQLYALSDALGRDGMQIALYDRRGRLVMLYTADDRSDQTICLYLPELRPEALLVQRRKAVLIGASTPRTVLAEDRLNRLTDPAALETVPLPRGLSLSIPLKAVSGSPTEQFSRLRQTPALQYRAPVHGAPPNVDYFIPVENSVQAESNNGLIELTLQLKAGDIQQIAAMTHTEINTFTDDRLVCGTLQTYTRLEAGKTEPVSFSAFVGKPLVSPVVSRKVGNRSYYESSMTIGNAEGPVGSVAVLLSRQSEQDAAFVLLFSISGAVVVFGLMAGAGVMRFSKSIAAPISRMVSSMQQLARGEPARYQSASIAPERAGFSEMQQINSALDDLVKAEEDTVTLAEAIAAGNLTVQITPRSAQDRLMFSLNHMVQQLNEHHTRTMRAMQEAEVANQALAGTNRKLEALSVTDALTGIANRRRFDEVLQQEYARHFRSGAELSLILLDVDHFKAFNDRYGHPQGDACLRQIATVLTDCTQRAADLAARYGGEEFACILPETNQHGAVAIAEQIRQAIMALAIPHAESQANDIVTVSLGVVTARCSNMLTAEALLALADEQLYAAKSGGRNAVRAADCS